MLLEHYLTTREYTERLCKPLATEDYVPQAVDFTSPPKWHLAHVTWFFEELILKPYLDGYQEFNADFCFLFNSYYQTVGERALRVQRGIYSRPTVEEVYQYRRHVDEYIRVLLSGEPEQAVKELVLLGIHHEQQHQELLLTDLKYVFELNLLHPVYSEEINLVNDHNSTEGWISLPEKLYFIGHEGDSFHYDNERGKHQVYLPAFEINHALVTNGEFMEFIAQGGYEHFAYWLDDGWTWRKEAGAHHPLYWQERDGQWYHYTLAGLKPIDENAMLCHVNYYEANAFACWKKMRLPTEFEWEAACNQFTWGKRWEWTNSAYLPYPGYRVSKGAVGEYNGKFMVNQMVLRGASVATSPGHSRFTYRNFFYPHMQWQFSGIRLVRDETNQG